MGVHGSAVTHVGCDACGSRDNVAVYEDGYRKCFSPGCGFYSYEDGGPEGGKVGMKVGLANLLHGTAHSLPKRRLSEETCAKYRYLVGDGVQLATYFDSAGRPCAQKVRSPDKHFRWVGNPGAAQLFGQQLFCGGGKQVVVTEGEIDALSMSQAMGNKWPVVSIPNGASAARRDLAKQVEWLDSFERIVLMFDQDEAGRLATAECAELFTPGKVRIAQLPLKDPNEMVVAGRTRDLLGAMYEAKVYRPDGIVEGTELIEEILKVPERGLTYPWPDLDRFTHGQRVGELVTWTAGTGIGKSQVLREIARFLHVEHGEKVGIIALEESTRHAARAQVSLEVDAPLHIPEVREKVSDDEIRAACERVLGGLFFYDHFGSVDAATLLPKIRFMVKALGVRWIVLDHVSIMVSGNATEGDERKRIDELMTKLRSLVEDLEIGMHVVSHLRKSSGTPFEEGGHITINDLRGSGAIGQVSNLVIGLERNQQCAKDPNRTVLRVLKNRFSGETGITGALAYDSVTGRLKPAALEEVKAPAAAPAEGGDF